MSSLRVAVPREWDDIKTHGALQALEKALKDPASSLERARARQAFLREQRRLAGIAENVFLNMADVGTTRDQAVIKRVHQRSIAILNATFARSYEFAFTCGLVAGGAARLPAPNELQMIRQQRLNENAYAANFLTDAASGEGVMDYKRRAKMYAQALEEVYWQGYLYADLSADRFVRWVIRHDPWGKPDENCVDCALLSGDTDGLSKTKLDLVLSSGRQVGGRWGNGVYQARELARIGIAPQSGKLACTTNCRCRLEPAQRPEGKGGETLPRFVSLRPKDFTGTARDDQGRVVVTRKTHQSRRKGYAKKAAETEHRHVPRGLMFLKKHLAGTQFDHDQSDHASGTPYGRFM